MLLLAGPFVIRFVGRASSAMGREHSSRCLPPEPCRDALLCTFSVQLHWEEYLSSFIQGTSGHTASLSSGRMSIRAAMARGRQIRIRPEQCRPPRTVASIFLCLLSRSHAIKKVCSCAAQRFSLHIQYLSALLSIRFSTARYTVPQRRVTRQRWIGQAYSPRRRIAVKMHSLTAPVLVLG